ncbi:hypothetical protein IPH67_00015 [bacterium]|nr:MAG: hypothetical protein IPH67_00015 [bacterium]
MGASINVIYNNKAVINGADELNGTSVAGEDIRAVCWYLRALQQRKLYVYGVAHWKQGFENSDQSLNSVGASMTLVEKLKNRH